MGLTGKLKIVSLQDSSSNDHNEGETTAPKSVPLFNSWFNVGFYLRLIPYQLRYDLEKKRWTLQDSKMSWGSCLMLTWIPFIIFAILSRVHAFINFSVMTTRSASSYFNQGNWYLNTFRCVNLMWILRCRKAEMESTINRCSLMYTTDQSNRIIMKTVLKRVQLYFFIVGTVYIATILGRTYIVRNGVFDWPINVFQGRIMSARKMLFLSVPGNSTSSSAQVEFSAGNIILGILYNWGHIAWLAVFLIPEFILMVPYPMTLWLATKQFELFLHRESEEAKNSEPLDSAAKLDDIEKRYEQLMELSTSLNGSWGKLNFIWHVTTMLRTIFNLQDINNISWNLSSSLLVLRSFIEVTYQAVALVISADVFVKMENFKQWLISQKNWSRFWMTDSRSKVERIYTELADDPVGVSYRGMYRCNYEFIAQLCAFVITIFVVTFAKD